VQPVLRCRAAKERQRAEAAAAEASERSAAELQAAREAAAATEQRATEAAAEAAKAAGELRDYKARWVLMYLQATLGRVVHTCMFIPSCPALTCQLSSPHRGWRAVGKPSTPALRAGRSSPVEAECLGEPKP
jgi:hypothetical protein